LTQGEDGGTIPVAEVSAFILAANSYNVAALVCM
jgi:hypothetical protein